MLLSVDHYVNPILFMQNLFASSLAEFYCGATKAATIYPSWICGEAEFRSGWVTQGSTSGATFCLKILSCSISSFIGQIKTR